MNFIIVRYNGQEYTAAPGTTIAQLFQASGVTLPGGTPKFSGSTTTVNTPLHVGGDITFESAPMVEVSLQAFGQPTVKRMVESGSTIDSIMRGLPDNLMFKVENGTRVNRYFNADGSHKYSYTSISTEPITEMSTIDATKCRIMMTIKVKGADVTNN